MTGIETGIEIMMWGVSVAAAAATPVVLLKVLWARRQPDITPFVYLRDDHLWVSAFLNRFDRLFGRRTFSRRRVFGSLLATMFSSAALWVLFGPLLGLMGTRSPDTLGLGEFLLMALAINSMVDFFSLAETRWLLNRFANWNSIPAQIALLIADAIFSGALIVIAVNGFRLFFGESPLQPIEMMAGYSTYSLFFYSTFTTSIWLWVYALGLMVVRIASGPMYHRWADHLPAYDAIGAAVFAIAFAVFTVLGSIMKLYGADDIDELLCRMFGGTVCSHAARLSTDPERMRDMLLRACQTGDPSQCSNAFDSLDIPNGRIAAELMQILCDESQDAAACSVAGLIYTRGIDGEINLQLGFRYTEEGCRLGDPYACENLGQFHAGYMGWAVNQSQAIQAFRTACDMSFSASCNSLAYMFQHGTPPDVVRAVELYRLACSLGSAEGCWNLAMMYAGGSGVPRDRRRAIEHVSEACQLGMQEACDAVNQSQPTPAPGKSGASLRGPRKHTPQASR